MQNLESGLCFKKYIFNCLVLILVSRKITVLSQATVSVVISTVCPQFGNDCLLMAPLFSLHYTPPSTPWLHPIPWYHLIAEFQILQDQKIHDINFKSQHPSPLAQGTYWIVKWPNRFIENSSLSPSLQRIMIHIRGILNYRISIIEK